MWMLISWYMLNKNANWPVLITEHVNKYYTGIYYKTTANWPVLIIGCVHKYYTYRGLRVLINLCWTCMWINLSSSHIVFIDIIHMRVLTNVHWSGMRTNMSSSQAPSVNIYFIVYSTPLFYLLPQVTYEWAQPVRYVFIHVTSLFSFKTGNKPTFNTYMYTESGDVLLKWQQTSATYNIHLTVHSSLCLYLFLTLTFSNKG